ncbi:hypothetical protein M422DRAFT_276059 [Sphaerobolus stellatus SS14]|uniref:Uncharacterized protein n=1 Tax=Sphaerobolus stellatus (strain SS14) TaxID=990650 RepID=A0A0C9U2T3_SPHS4|nr:hypothetical protein M422DRAFT_276059 [Sphaerobolus stellatus SS14]
MGLQVLKHHDKVSTPFRAKTQAEKTSEDVEYTVVKTIPEAKQVVVGTLHAVKHSDISEDKKKKGKGDSSNDRIKPGHFGWLKKTIRQGGKDWVEGQSSKFERGGLALVPVRIRYQNCFYGDSIRVIAYPVARGSLHGNTSGTDDYVTLLYMSLHISGGRGKGTWKAEAGDELRLKLLSPSNLDFQWMDNLTMKDIISNTPAIVKASEEPIRSNTLLEKYLKSMVYIIAKNYRHGIKEWWY